MDTNDNKYKNYQLITTDDEGNDKYEDPIDSAKQPPSDAEKNETALLSSVTVVPIVGKNDPVFPSAKVPDSLT